MLARERVNVRVTGVQGLGLKAGLLYLLYLCNQRDMLMLFFGFSVAWGSEAGLGRGGGQREEVQDLAPFGLLANHVLFLLILG